MLSHLASSRAIARNHDLASAVEIYAHRIRIAPSAASKAEHEARLSMHRSGNPLQRSISRGGGIRGKIKGMSAGSRARLMGKILAWHDVPNVMLTLTYPDEPANDPKRDLKNFKMRLARNYPAVTGVWRMEIVPRKSGQLRGVFMPHFHLILHVPDGVDYERFKRDASEMWTSVCRKDFWTPRNAELHKRRGTDCQRIRSAQGALSYASKYIAKEDKAESIEAGRSWGLIGKPNMTRIAVIEIPRLWRDELAHKVCLAIRRRAPKSKGIRSVLFYRRWAYQSVNAHQYGSNFGKTVLQLLYWAKAMSGDGLQVIPKLLR